LGLKVGCKKRFNLAALSSSVIARKDATSSPLTDALSGA
jgi:hypothetical protein